jgi:hypothetical protein
MHGEFALISAARIPNKVNPQSLGSPRQLLGLRPQGRARPQGSPISSRPLRGAIPRTAPGPKLCPKAASINLTQHQLRWSSSRAQLGRMSRNQLSNKNNKSNTTSWLHGTNSRSLCRQFCSGPTFHDSCFIGLLINISGGRCGGK